MKLNTRWSAAIIATALVASAAAAAAPPCESIHLAPETGTGAVQGTAPPDGAVCYEISGAAGKTVTVDITGNNVMFSVGGLADGQTQYSFRAENRSYEIRIGQLMRSVSKEPFVLSITVR